MQVLSHLDYDHYDDHYHLDDHIDYSFRLVDGGEGSLKVFKSEKYAYGRFYPASGTPSYGIRGWPATNEALAEDSGEGEDGAEETEESGEGADEAEESEESGKGADGVEEAEESGEGEDEFEESGDYFEDPPEGGHVFYEDA